MRLTDREIDRFEMILDPARGRYTVLDLLVSRIAVDNLRCYVVGCPDSAGHIRLVAEAGNNGVWQFIIRSLHEFQNSTLATNIDFDRCGAPKDDVWSVWFWLVCIARFSQGDRTCLGSRNIRGDGYDWRYCWRNVDVWLDSRCWRDAIRRFEQSLEPRMAKQPDQEQERR